MTDTSGEGYPRSIGDLQEQLKAAQGEFGGIPTHLAERAIREAVDFAALRDLEALGMDTTELREALQVERGYDS